MAHFASMHAEDAAEGREPMFTVHVSDMESDKPEGSDGQPATRFKRCQRVTIAPPMRADGADVLRGADAVVRTVLLQPGGAETLYEIGVLDLGSRIWGQKMGSNSEGSRLVESERGVWFWLNRHSICTPHFNRKNELILFRGRKTVSGAQARTSHPTL